MRMEDLMPGCKVDIRITQLMEKEDVDAAQGIYYTSIFDVTKDSIELQMPMVGGRLQLLPKNIRYEFIFSAPMGLYKAQGTVTDHIKKQHFYLLKIVLTSPLEKSSFSTSFQAISMPSMEAGRYQRWYRVPSKIRSFRSSGKS